MAECASSKQENNIVKCGICLSAFTKPILLNCFHIFCTPCVAKLVEGKNGIICPLCKAVHALPDNGVDGLTTYPYVQEGAPPHANENILCQMCGNGKNAVSKCINCDNNMCLECNAYHLKHLTFKTHKIEKIEIDCSEIKLPEIIIIEDVTCKSHEQDLSLFCASCNIGICTKCLTFKHKLHKSEPIMFSAQRMRGLLQSAIGTIKSKITEIDHEIEISKCADNNHYKLCTQWKEEIKTHAKRSKETVCRIIDVLADLNLHSIDEMMNCDIKSINNFQDELETKKLSLRCLLKSTNDIVKQCGDGKLLTDYAFLYNTLQNAVTQENRLVIFAPQFCFGNQIERNCIEQWFGLVTRREKPSIVGTSEIQIYSLPVVCNVTKFTKKRSFTFEKTLRLYGTCENKAWIQHTAHMGGECIQRYSTEGSEFYSYAYNMYKVNINNEHHILRATLDELLVKCGELFKKIIVGYQVRTIEIVRMPRSEKDTCCVFDDNRVVTYCVRDNCFNEVNIDGNWPVTLNKTTLKVTHADKKLRNFITTEPFMITETCLKRIILTCQNKVVTLDKNFRICYVHENKGSDFRSICGDPYGNIFIVDYNLGNICLFNSNGNFLRNVSVQGISSPVDITRDSVGNIWLADKKNQTGKNIMTFEQFKSQYPVKANFVEYYDLVSAIPGILRQNYFRAG